MSAAGVAAGSRARQSSITSGLRVRWQGCELNGPDTVTVAYEDGDDADHFHGAARIENVACGRGSGGRRGLHAGVSSRCVGLRAHCGVRTAGHAL